ncbi:hypothetical protein [Erwinia sp. B116]|uniref:hypothetical protein n=1 Tax=Erwinia sp. B116 TaxID=1561024 RepID=UPI0011AF99E7|nr:hypothetical protein [Erwinia sp. B116]
MQKKHSFPGILVRYKSLLEDCSHSKNCNCFPEQSNENEMDSLNESILEDNDDKKNKNANLKNHEKHLDDELHVNLWEIGEDNPSPFLDIGVMIHDHKNVDEVVVDLPWELDKKDINDLGSKLSSEKSVAAIFNEVVHYDGLAEGNFANISFRRNGVDEKPFCLFRLNSQSFRIEYIPISNDTSSTRVLIKLPKYTNRTTLADRRKSAYIRFRIKGIPPSVYTTNFSYKDEALISSSIHTRIIDFRINVMRGVPEELMHSNDDLIFPAKLKRIHCFLTTIRNEECISVSKYYNGYRSLVDEEIWNEYIKLDNLLPGKKTDTINSYLGYQWTIKNEKESEIVKDLIVLGRFSKKKSNSGSILRFILVVVLLGALGSGLWESMGSLASWFNNDLLKNTEEHTNFINLSKIILLSLIVSCIVIIYRRKAD